MQCEAQQVYLSPPPELKHCDVYLKQIGPMRRSYRENPISAFQCPRRELQA